MLRRCSSRLVAYFGVHETRQKIPPDPTTGGGRGPMVGELYGVLASFLGPDAHSILDRTYEDLAIANLACPGGLDDGFERAVYELVHKDHLDFDLGKKVDGVFAAAIDLSVPLL